MTKHQVYEEELKKLNELFKDIDENTQKLVEGLIQDAAFLYAKNYELRGLLDETGFIKIHPQHKELQKPVPAAKEFRQNLAIYSVIIKTLYGILGKVDDGEDDDLEEFE